MKGIHYIIDFNNLEFDFLNNLDKLKLIMELTIKKSNYRFKLVRTEFSDFSSTLRNKLLWGQDRRN